MYIHVLLLEPCELTDAEEPRGAGGGMGTEGSEACSAATGLGRGARKRESDMSQLTNVEGGAAWNSRAQQHRPELMLQHGMRIIAVCCSKPQF